MSHYIKYENWKFPANKIKGGNIHIATSLLSESLEANAFTADVECDSPSILNFKRNSTLLYYPNTERSMIWKVQSITRIGPTLYRISATSTLGLLIDGKHYGGIYSGAYAEDVIRDICGSVPVYIKGALRKVKLYGWLPIATPRDNLAQVLLAIGAVLKTDMDGTLRIETLWDGIGWEVGANRMYAESKAEYTAPVTSVIVTEHQYIEGTEERELYSGDTLSGSTVTFTEPMHSLTAEGFKILSSGANWAKLSAGVGTLRGKPYIHNTNEVEQRISNWPEPNVKTIGNATLISFFNSRPILQRVAAFYQLRESINAPVKYQGEIPGDILSEFHPFSRASVSACLQSADITLSNVLKAQEKSLIGFKPEKLESYNTQKVFLESGTWTVPSGVTSIRVLLVGGGDGGQAGEDGKSPESENGYAYDHIGGTGGQGGVAGSGGAIYQFYKEVSPGETYSITIGSGGAAGQRQDSGNTKPGVGQPTIFKQVGSASSEIYSSASGHSIDSGYTDPFSGELYGKRGQNGISGGAGGNGGALVNGEGETYDKQRNGKDGLPAQTAGTTTKQYLGGSGGKGAVMKDGGESTYRKIGTGGGGGGGAYGENGSDGLDGYVDTSSGIGGNGGHGGNAHFSWPEWIYTRGGGGNGGHGGGGRGGAGSGYTSSGSGAYNGYPGLNGKGGHGTIGIPGVAVIYYQSGGAEDCGLLLDSNEKIFLDRFGRRIIV